MRGSQPRGARKSWVIAISGVLCSASVAACSAVLGIGDRTLDPELAEGSAGDASPEGGAMQDAAAPIVLAMQLNHPYSLAVDTNNAYWTEFGSAPGTKDGAVKSCPLTGCPSSGPIVLAAALTNPRGIAVDGTNVYFATATYSSVVGTISSCPLAGCNGSNPTLLASADLPSGITLDATYVYWVDNDDGSVHRVPKAGGSATTLLSSNNTPLVEGENIVVDSENAYVSDFNQNVIRLPIAGGAVVQMITGQIGSACPIAIDATYLYYVSGMQLMRTDKTSKSAGTAIATGIQQAVDVALDPTTSEIYWADFGSGLVNDGTLGKVGTNGQGQTLLASSLPAPEAVRISGNFLVWLSNGETIGDAAGTANSSGTLNRQSK